MDAGAPAVTGSGRPLPAGWAVRWSADAEDVPPGTVHITREGAGAASTSVAFFEQGRAAWSMADERPASLTVRLEPFPTLDDVWTLFMWTRAERPAAWEAMCRYAADVRQGYWPDRVKPELAVQSVYLAIAQHHLLAEPPDRERFLAEALALCATVARKLEAGGRLLDDAILDGEPAFERYVSLLRKDRRLYLEDRERASRFLATVPAARDPKRVERTLPLLLLARPIATQFKLWARTDPQAPGGNGYPLLLVELEPGRVVLSADPASRTRVGWLAAPLTAAERARDESTDDAWYDGRDHEGTLVAAPAGGTRLSLEDVAGVLKRELRLRPIRKKLPLREIGLGALLAGGLVGLAVWLWPAGPGDDGGGGVADPGRPLDRAEVRRVVDRFQSMGEEGDHLTGYALLAGVCSYTGDRELHSPCRDARALQRLLIDHYGYDPDHIMLFVDDEDATADQHPTASNLRLGLERFEERFGRQPESSFLFFYSGHGTYRRGARRHYGLLQPAGFFESDGPEDERGWDMQDVRESIQKHIRSRHVMILLDSCQAGWATESMGDVELPPELRSNWEHPAEVVLAAASRSELAWSDDPTNPRWDGLSVFTYALLNGLTPDADGAVRADANHDGVVVDHELASYTREQVLALVRRANKPDQHPQFRRWDESGAVRGQFLLVPHPRDD
jgi:hypothetical protein